MESIIPLEPSRLLETRVGPGLSTTDGDFDGIGRLGAGETLELGVAGRGGVPADATAVLINATAVMPSAAGFLTVWACGRNRPTPASNVNYTTGSISPNAVLTEIGTGGSICIYTLAETDIVVDVNGYVPDGGALVPVVPARLFESRSGPADETVDGQFEGVGRLPAGGVVEIPIRGRGGVTDSAVAALLNVTAVNAAFAGFLTVYSCDSPRPIPASNVNYEPGNAYPNAVLTQLSESGTVCVYSLVQTDLVVDVNAYLEFGSTLSTALPLRMLETRSTDTETTFDGEFEGAGPLAADTVLEVQIAGRGSVPTGATTVVMNLTAVGATAGGYLTAYACDRKRPDPASNVNYGPGGAFPNAVVAQLSTDGKVCIYALTETDVIIDVVGSVGGAGSGIDLTDIEISDGAKQPLDRVPVNGLDLQADLDEFTVQLSVAGVRYGTLPVRVDDAGPYVIAPFHPISPTMRSTVTLTPADGDRLGSSATIDLLPLAAASGAWRESIASVRSAVASKAIAEGSSISDVRGTTFASLEPRLAFLKMLDQWIDDGSTNDLGSLYAGDRMISPAERSLVDAVAARLGLTGSLGADMPTSTRAAQRSSRTSLQSASTGEAATARATANPARLVESTTGCQPSSVEIDTAEQLVEAMELAAEAKGETQGAQRAALNQLSNFLGAAQYLPSGFGDTADLIASLITISYAFDLIDYFENPSELTSLTPLGTSTFNEDFTAPGDLTGALVKAENAGGSLEEAFAAAMTELAALAVGVLLPSTEGPLLEFAVRVISNIGKEALKDRLDDPRDAVPICSGGWTVDINDPELIEARAALGRLDIETSGDTVKFRPNQLAPDTLIVTARPEKFANRSATGQLPVTVRTIQILLTPDPVFIPGPTNQFELTAQILNADDSSLEWTTPTGTFTTTGFDETVTIQYSTADLPIFPHVVSVRSTSTSGLRTAGAPPRTGTTTVNVGGIRIVPSQQSVLVGEHVDFDVLDSEDQPVADANIQWQADGGSIDTNGVYTAGSTPGTYSVTAVLEADPSKVAVASVTVSDECTVGTWALQVQRYLDDLYAYGLAEFGEAVLGELQSGSEQLTISPDTPGDDVFYPEYVIESSLSILYDDGDSASVLETRGVDAGLVDPSASAGTRLGFILDDLTLGIERRSIFDGEALPWLPGNPFGPAGGVFSELYICGATEMAIGGDGSSPVASYWSRL